MPVLEKEPTKAPPAWVDLMDWWSGDRLQQIRKARDLDQGELADKAGTRQNNISRWENEEATPKADDLFKLADALGVSCEEFRKPAGSPIAWRIKPPKQRKPESE